MSANVEAKKPAVGGKAGRVNFNCDVGTLMVDVEVTRQFDVTATVVSLDVFTFLKVAGQIQTAVAERLHGGLFAGDASRPQ